MDEKKPKKFISERILGRELTWGRAAKYILLSLVCGLVFGMAAALVLHFVAPKEKAEIAGGETVTEAATEETVPTTEESVSSAEETMEETTVPEETAETSGSEESEESTSAEENTEESATAEEDPEETAESTGETGEGAEEETDLLETVPVFSYEYFSTAADAISKFVVPVILTIDETSWFESTMETSRRFAGLLLERTEDEIHVLAPVGAVGIGERISVILPFGSERPALAKQYSYRDGLAVISISTAGIPESYLEELSFVKYSEKEPVRGMVLSAAGAPLGTVGSFDFGTAGYLSKGEHEVDFSLDCMYSAIASNADMGTFLFDENGDLAGVALPSETGSAGGTRIVQIGCIADLIRRMEAGEEYPYLGLTLEDSDEPKGVYIYNVEQDSPAYEAGINRGDILVQAGEIDIREVKDFRELMSTLLPGTPAVLTVLRSNGSGGYARLDIEITAGAR